MIEFGSDCVALISCLDLNLTILSGLSDFVYESFEIMSPLSIRSNACLSFHRQSSFQLSGFLPLFLFLLIISISDLDSFIIEAIQNLILKLENESLRRSAKTGNCTGDKFLRK